MSPRRRAKSFLEKRTKQGAFNFVPLKKRLALKNEKRVLDAVTSNRGLTSPEIASKLGLTESKVSGALKRLRQKGILQRTQHEKIVPGKPIYGHIVVDLRDTIDSMPAIVQKFGVKGSIIYRISQETQARRGELLRKGSLTNLLRWGIDYTKLDTPYRQLSSEQKQRIMQENRSDLWGYIERCRDPNLKKGLYVFLQSELNKALDKYHPDLCSEKHFVLLCLKKAYRRFLVSNARGLTKEELQKLPSVGKVSYQQFESMLNKNYDKFLGEIKRKIRGHSFADAEDVLSLTIETALTNLAAFDPQKHGSLEKFIFDLAKSHTKEFNVSEIGRSSRLRQYQSYQSLWVPHLRNKKKNTQFRQPEEG